MKGLSRYDVRMRFSSVSTVGSQSTELIGADGYIALVIWGRKHGADTYPMVPAGPDNSTKEQCVLEPRGEWGDDLTATHFVMCQSYLKYQHPVVFLVSVCSCWWMAKRDPSLGSTFPM